MSFKQMDDITLDEKVQSLTDALWWRMVLRGYLDNSPIWLDEVRNAS